MTGPLAEGGADLVQGMVIFLLAGLAMVLGALVVGWFLRPKLPHPDKQQAYECGEPTIGSSWVQFDLRFYVVALVFLVFDVEVALFYPWAVVFGAGTTAVKAAATWDMLFFFGVIVVGFLYLWRFGYLDWVRASTGGRVEESAERPAIAAPIPPPAPRKKYERVNV
ncbi:MAG: NADH-quinone oxidoreductase subunit A [Planctomycetes bacterium]|nr:NADH-quinone oxidoreductase subunit A [Planctomycetota bacterium]